MRQGHFRHLIRPSYAPCATVRFTKMPHVKEGVECEGEYKTFYVEARVAERLNIVHGPRGSCNHVTPRLLFTRASCFNASCSN